MKTNGEIFYGPTNVRSICFQMITHAMHAGENVWNSRFTKNTVKHGGGNHMVYGGFSWYGVGPMHLIMDTMTILSYNYILETVKLPYTSENMSLIWSLQQDNNTHV